LRHGTFRPDADLGYTIDAILGTAAGRLLSIILSGSRPPHPRPLSIGAPIRSRLS